MSALLESLVYNRKRAAARSYNICRPRDIVSGSTAIEMNGYTCYSPHRVLFRASSEDRTRSAVSSPSSLCLLLWTLSRLVSRSRGNSPPLLPPPSSSPTPASCYVLPLHVVPVLCVSEAEETRKADPRSGVVKIRRAVTPDTAGNGQRET